jgi:LuxR family transcriptional regulator, maltose regulon positive regulatory protein
MTLQSTELPFITKIVISKRRDYIVCRDRLLDPMKARLDKRVQIVCAPAGHGKTALLVEFASGLDLPVCWYSFGPEDYDPVGFLRYCVHLVRSRFANFGANYQHLLKGGSNADWRTQLGFFISALHSDIAGQLIFVFDDLHWILGKQELEEAFSLLIQRSPVNIHFALGSRVWPSLPCLPKLAAKDELDSFDTRDLRFSTEETVHLLHRLWERPVTLKEAQAVNDCTGGWAAAIVLTAKSQATSAVLDPVRHGHEGGVVRLPLAGGFRQAAGLPPVFPAADFHSSRVHGEAV